MKTTEPKEHIFGKSIYETNEQLHKLWAGKLSTGVNLKKLVE